MWISALETLEAEVADLKCQLAEAKGNLAASEMTLRNTAERMGDSIAYLNSKFAEAQATIAKLREDRCASCRVKDRLGL